MAAVAVQNLREEKLKRNGAAPGRVAGVFRHQLGADVSELIPGHGVIVIGISDALGIEQIFVVGQHKRGVVMGQSIQGAGSELLGSGIIPECTHCIGPDILNAGHLILIQQIIQSKNLSLFCVAGYVGRLNVEYIGHGAGSQGGSHLSGVVSLLALLDFNSTHIRVFIFEVFQHRIVDFHLVGLTINHNGHAFVFSAVFDFSQEGGKRAATGCAYCGLRLGLRSTAAAGNGKHHGSAEHHCNQAFQPSIMFHTIPHSYVR